MDIPGVTGPSDPAEYDKWFRAKVQESLDDPRPPIPHAQVMADMDAIIEDAVARRQARTGEAGAASE
ncbi:antitoxin [Paraburkholderia sp. UCT31]|nr:antitoxin [Paraburkholderia sp. UCT31]